MVMKGFIRNFKPLEILTEEQIEAIHCGTLDILGNVGVRIEHDQALKLFEKNDCKVDHDERRVRIPPGLVEECLRKAPSSFHIKARDPKNDLKLGGNTTYFTCFPGMRILDLDTWETRPATKQENADGVKVLDALDNLHFISPYAPYFEVKGIPPPMAIPESVAAKIRHSTKALRAGSQLGCEIFNMRMAIAVGTDIATVFSCAPPLTFRSDAVECAFRVSEAGFPLQLSGGALMGATAPVTIAGALQSVNAQHIAAIVLTQLIKAGTRVIVQDIILPQDMRSGSPVFGSIESSLHHVAFNQIWRKYGIPTSNSSCGASASKAIDFQCGYEKASATLLAALSGASYVSLHGGVYGELAFHPVQAILDDDIAGMIGRFIEGINVNYETLALDLIEEVGPIPGIFLDKDHTRKWWKKEQFLPQAADRQTYPEWMMKGKKGAIDYAKERMEQILATHHPKPLTPKQEAEVEKILSEARNYYREKGML